MTIQIEGHLTLDEFARKLGRIPKEAFLLKNKIPFLLLELRGTNLSDKGTFSTVAPAETLDGEDRPLAGSNLRPADVAVVPIEKTHDSDETGVTLGRAISADIVVMSPSVSKLHAVFRPSASKTFSIEDAGSSYGTVVGSHTLMPGKPVTLTSSVSIVFGKAVRASFFTPSELFDYIEVQRKFKRLP
jgi:hypothetical protein